jgi:N utilization substance protein B
MRSGMLRALEKRPVSSEQLEAVIQRILHKLQASGERDISSRLLGEWVMEELSQLDPVAYVRFASVYRSFQDVNAFHEEIQKLKNEKSSMNQKPNPYMRQRARRLLVQALYQWRLSGNNLAEIEIQFLSNAENVKKLDILYFRELLHAIPESLDTIEALLIPYLDRPLKEISPIELAILRLSGYELNSRIDIPYKVVINEALELAKVFGADESYKYINSIVDRVALQVRKIEYQTSSK